MLVIFYKQTRQGISYVLMQISDCKQLENSRLILVVQALEKIRVVKAKRHIPYAIPTVEIIPDRELVEIIDFRTTKDEADEDNNEDYKELLPKAVDEAF